ncbi:MAG: hypothetical protein ACK5SK_08910 [Cyclobacteriaceae bacterium]
MDTLITLLGVALGASIGLLSPFVQEFVYRYKRRRTLKYDIVFSISRFYSISKEHVQTLNNQNWLSQKIVHLTSEGNLVDKDRALEEFNKRVDRADRSYDKLVDIEATIQKLVFETREVYGKDIHRSIKSLLIPVLKNSNSYDYCNLYRFHQLNSKDIDAISPTLAHEIFQKQEGIQKECDTMIAELDAVFK